MQSSNRIKAFFTSLFAFFGLLLGLFISSRIEDEVEVEFEAEDFE